MQVSFQKPYLSIIEFPTTNLPDFTLITGPNGAGKSHLLTALDQGNVRADCAPHQNENNRSEIRYFDWSTLVPQDTGALSSEVIRSERQNAYNELTNKIRDYYPIVRSAGEALGLPASMLEVSIIAAISKEEIVRVTGKPRAEIDQLYLNLENALQNMRTHVNGQVTEVSRRHLYSVADRLNKSIFTLTEAEITSPTIPTWGLHNLFQQSFGRIFLGYRDLYLSNLLAKFRSEQGEEGVQFLSDAEFRQEHGLPPWDIVNETLREANLDFEIPPPYLYDFSMYHALVKKRSSGVPISFNALSSGEKVLMSLAFCVFYATDSRHLAQYPKVILLDEVDAPLHPSMTQNLLNVIQNVLVGKFGIKVIAATHAPSTVALAPDACLFIMKPGIPGLQKIDKSTALSILCEGVPHLSISFDGRRQVFVESHADAVTYEGLYRLAKGGLLQGRSLEFVPTGMKTAVGGEVHSGCDIVKSMVEQLSASGNKSIFGIIDWDGKNHSESRLFVLAEEERDGLENVLLDPILIASIIIRDFPQGIPLLGLEHDLTLLEFLGWPVERLQSVADKVVELVLGQVGSEKVDCSYANGISVTVSKEYFHIDDHALEEKILLAFPFLKAVTRADSGAGKLMQKIVDTVIRDHKGFLPQPVIEIFRRLLATEI